MVVVLELGRLQTTAGWRGCSDRRCCHLWSARTVAAWHLRKVHETD